MGYFQRINEMASYHQWQCQLIEAQLKMANESVI